MMIRFLDVMVKKSVMVMAESDEELEEKRQKIVHDVIDENLYNSKYIIMLWKYQLHIRQRNNIIMGMR